MSDHTPPIDRHPIKLGCKERDQILHETGRYDGWDVHSGLTDIHGTYGEPRIETVWTRNGRYIQDIRHPNPNGGQDIAPCEHYEIFIPPDDD